jgi:hypothetical protein
LERDLEHRQIVERSFFRFAKGFEKRPPTSTKVYMVDGLALNHPVVRHPGSLRPRCCIMPSARSKPPIERSAPPTRCPTRSFVRERDRGRRGRPGGSGADRNRYEATTSLVDPHVDRRGEAAMLAEERRIVREDSLPA